MKNRVVLLFAGRFMLPCLVSAGWIRQAPGTANNLYSVHFPVDALTGYAVGEGGTILKIAETWRR